MANKHVKKQLVLDRIEIDPFRLAMCILHDNREWINGDDFNFIEGSIRSRSFTALSSIYRSQGPDQRGTHEVRALAQIQALFKKNASFGSEADRIATTWKSFTECEETCKIVNERFDTYMLDRTSLSQKEEADLLTMKRVIADILGPLDPFIDSLPGRLRVTPGASASESRTFSAPFRKVPRRRGWIYAGSRPLLEALSRWFGFVCNPKITNFNKVSMVPKQWDKHRLIAAEASWALPLQLAVGDFLKERLLQKCQIDLSSQTVNQEFAREGSITGSLCTIDLSSASDTISRSLVEYLLPTEWFLLLSSLRAPFWRHKDETGVYAKFSSMGNGFTFGLETLLFYACVYAAGASRATVYGDDICVDAESYDRTVSVLSFCGFTVNDKKSFKTGPFRESCGVDYHNGINVRPYFLEKNVITRRELSNLVNRFGALRLGEKVADLLGSLVRDNKIPLVPTNVDTSSGVFVTEGYRARFSYGLHQYYGLTAFSKKSSMGDTKRYWYWLFLTRERVKEATEHVTRMREYRWSREALSDPLVETSVSESSCESTRCKWLGLQLKPIAPETYLWTATLLNKLSKGSA